MSIIEKAVGKFESAAAEAEGKPLGHKRGNVNRRFSKNQKSDLSGSGPVAEHLTKLDALHVVDLNQLDERTPKALRSPDAIEKTNNEFARIKHPILNNIKQFGEVGGCKLNVVMVASALEGEGKSYTSINLARNLAKSSEKHVVLIDVDIIKKDITTTLSLNDAIGLTDVITGACKQVEKAVCNTNIPNLQVVSAGRDKSADPELLSGEHMRQFINFLLGPKKNSDVVVVLDSSPMLSTSEAQFLATLAGQVLFVVNASQTPAGAVKHSLEYIDNAKPIGMVLNRASSKEMSGYYAPYNYSALSQK